MPLPAPSSSWTSKTIMAAASAELKPSKMEAAEIEMLCDEEEAAITRTYDSRPFCVRRRRCILVCTILFLLIIGVAVAGITIYGREDDDEEAKPSKQEGDNTNAVLPPNDNADTASGNPPSSPPPPPTPSRSTPHPTATRTLRPTTSPSQSPTTAPTKNPTATPTSSPIQSVTPEPTRFPVAQAEPTGAPPTAEPPANSITMSPTIESAQTPMPADASDGAYADWYNAQVTLDSGPMFEIVDQLIHDPNAFTQGLTLAPDGRLFESTGLNGQSTIRELNPKTGEVIESVPLDAQYFGEGLAFANDKLVQITWKKAVAFVWNANDLQEEPQLVRYETTKRNEGWGITLNPETNEFIVSDGSNNLIYWKVDNLETIRTLPVTRLDGSAAKNMNELEFWRGRVLANVWFEDVILIIHPETGIVEKEYDFSSLWPSSDRPSGTNVFNGISISDNDDILYVTGKKWNRMYKIKLLP